MFLVTGRRSTFVVRGSILQTGRKENTPDHLSMRWVTHWRSLPPPPEPTP
jgi:hypothetical protein